MPITSKSYLDIRFNEPKMYLVTIINDRYLPWEFCVNLLLDIFYKNEAQAEALADLIVTEGEAICGCYPFEVAESKAMEVELRARKEEYHLYCFIEEV